MVSAPNDCLNRLAHNFIKPYTPDNMWMRSQRGCQLRVYISPVTVPLLEIIVQFRSWIKYGLPTKDPTEFPLGCDILAQPIGVEGAIGDKIVVMDWLGSR